MKDFVNRPDLKDVPEEALWSIPLFESVGIDSPMERDLLLARLDARIRGLRRRLDPNGTLQYKHRFNWR